MLVIFISLYYTVKFPKNTEPRTKLFTIQIDVEKAIDFTLCVLNYSTISFKLDKFRKNMYFSK